jgi:hypothetical protein
MIKTISAFENLFPFETKLVLLLETLPNYHQFVNIIFETLKNYAKVATLNLSHIGK